MSFHDSEEAAVTNPYSFFSWGLGQVFGGGGLDTPYWETMVNTDELKRYGQYNAAASGITSAQLSNMFGDPEWQAISDLDPNARAEAYSIYNEEHPFVTLEQIIAGGFEALDDFLGTIDDEDTRAVIAGSMERLPQSPIYDPSKDTLGDVPVYDPSVGLIGYEEIQPGLGEGFHADGTPTEGAGATPQDPPTQEQVDARNEGYAEEGWGTIDSTGAFIWGVNALGSVFETDDNPIHNGGMEDMPQVINQEGPVWTEREQEIWAALNDWSKAQVQAGNMTGEEAMTGQQEWDTLSPDLQAQVQAGQPMEDALAEQQTINDLGPTEPLTELEQLDEVLSDTQANPDLDSGTYEEYQDIIFDIISEGPFTAEEREEWAGATPDEQAAIVNEEMQEYEINDPYEGDDPLGANSGINSTTDPNYDPNAPIYDMDGNEITGPAAPDGTGDEGSGTFNPDGSEVGSGGDSGGGFNPLKIFMDMIGMGDDEQQAVEDGIIWENGAPGSDGSDSSQEGDGSIDWLGLLADGFDLYTQNEQGGDLNDALAGGILPNTDAVVVGPGGTGATSTNIDDTRVVTASAGDAEANLDFMNQEVIPDALSLADQSIRDINDFDADAWLETARLQSQPMIERLMAHTSNNLFNTGTSGLASNQINPVTGENQPVNLALSSMFSSLLDYDQGLVLESENQHRLFDENARGNLSAGVDAASNLTDTAGEILDFGYDAATVAGTAVTSDQNFSVQESTTLPGLLKAGYDPSSGDTFWNDVFQLADESGFIDAGVDWAKDVFGF